MKAYELYDVATRAIGSEAETVARKIMEACQTEALKGAFYYLWQSDTLGLTQVEAVCRYLKAEGFEVTDWDQETAKKDVPTKRISWEKAIRKAGSGDQI